MIPYSDEDSMDLRDADDWDKVLDVDGPSVRTAFARWALSLKEHTTAYLLNRAINTELVGLDENREFDLERLIAQVVRANRSSQAATGIQRL